MVQGSLSNASKGAELVLSKLYDLQSIQQLTSTLTTKDLNVTLPMESSPPSFIVRLLIPSTFCGKIIGRSGSNIKSLKDQSIVSYIQLSPKEHEYSSERIMTIIGPNLSSCVKCIQLILEDMALNSEISRYINLTTIYPLLLPSPTSSSYATASAGSFYMERESFHHVVLPGDSSTFTSSTHHPYGQGMFPSSPRSTRAAPSSPSYPQYQQSPSQSGQFCPPFFPTGSPDRDERSPFGSENLFPVGQLDHAASTPITVKLGVPASKIGSIIGRGGKTLTELQALSHAKIRISQQGEYIPGTQNRIVTITGNSVQNVEHAKLLVRQCMESSGSRSSHNVNDII